MGLIAQLFGVFLGAAFLFGIGAAPVMAQEEEAAQDPSVSEQSSERALEQVAPSAQVATKPSQLPPANAGSNASQEKPPLIPTAHFASRGDLWDAQLSPDGKALSFVRKQREQFQMVVTLVDGGKLLNTMRFARGTSIMEYQWVSNDKMLLRVSSVAVRYGWYVRYTRLILAEPKLGKFDFLNPNPRGLTESIVHVSDDADYALVAHRGDGRFHYPSVFRYDLNGDKEPVRIQEPKKGVWAWAADNDGIVRLGTGWFKRRFQIWYRSDESSKLEKIGKVKPGDREGFFDAIQVISGSDKGYVLDENEDGRVGVRLYDYAKREIAETFYENPDWDVEELWMQDGKPLAALYTDDRSQIVWFDDEYAAAYKDLQGILPDMQISITSRSDTADRMLVWASSEADPGVLYYYDRSGQKLQELAQYRPKIDFRQLAKPKAFTYQARDGTDIRAFLTLPKGREAKNLPLIIHPHGGPFGIRDKLRYDDQVQFFANRGYAVIQPNFRGSGGYGDAFYDLGVGEVGRGMQDDLDDAMDWAVAEGIADPNRVCVIGGSYGGYAALWAVLRNPERYRCGASWAGVTDWDKMLRYDRRYLTSKAGKRWQNKIEGDDKSFDLDDVSPYRLADNLNRPVLLAHGSADSNVPIKQYELMNEAAADAPMPPQTLLIEGEGHSFSKKENEQKWYDALDTFLAKHNPADQLDAEGKFVAPAPEDQDDLFKPVTLPGT